MIGSNENATGVCRWRGRVLPTFRIANWRGQLRYAGREWIWCGMRGMGRKRER